VVCFLYSKTKTEIMSIDKRNADVNHQDHPHQEGAQNNIPPIHHRDGQRRSDNNNHAMSSMKKESPEQKAGPAHGQKDEGWVQQEERQP
jgi:hypothetical protein